MWLASFGQYYSSLHLKEYWHKNFFLLHKVARDPPLKDENLTCLSV